RPARPRRRPLTSLVPCPQPPSRRRCAHVTTSCPTCEHLYSGRPSVDRVCAVRHTAGQHPAGQQTGAKLAELVSLAEAVERAIHDGDAVAMEGFTHLIPFAAGHEVIRQRRRDLTLI